MTDTVPQTVRNGVDTATLFTTLDAIKAQPQIARFQFRARNRWIDGAHNRSTIKDFYGAGAEDTSREKPFILDAGEPPVLLGANTGPNPAEYLLHALAACVTISVVYVAAARGVRLNTVESTLEGDLDAQGAFGLSGEVRNGFEHIRMTIRVAGDAPADTPRAVVQRGTDRSVVFRQHHRRRAGGRRCRHRLTGPIHPNISWIRTMTRLSSVAGARARRPRCCWPAAASGCSSSRPPARAPTPCPRTR
jgi:uncharacterized OsmC-like protein